MSLKEAAALPRNYNDAASQCAQASMNILIIVFLGLIAISLAVGIYALYTGRSEMLKWSLTARISLSVAIFAIFVVYTTIRATAG